jgi:hypothetical protein
MHIHTASGKGAGNGGQHAMPMDAAMDTNCSRWMTQHMHPTKRCWEVATTRCRTELHAVKPVKKYFKLALVPSNRMYQEIQ